MRARGKFAVLGEPQYRRLFWGRTISLVGDGLAPVAIAFAVLGLSGSATDLGLVLAAHGLTIAVFILAGGVFADRVSPRLAMLRADLVRTVTAGAMAVLLIAGVAEVWHLAVLYAVQGVATAFFNPASSAIVPQVVGTGRLQEATALLSVSHASGQFAGPAIAGLLLALGTPGWALAVDAATFGLSALFLLAMRPQQPAAAAEPAFLSELREGWREFSSRTWLWTIVLAAAISNAVFWPAFMVLGPLVANNSLGGSSAWALIAAASGAGAVIGGAVGLSLRPSRPLLACEAAVAVIALPIVLLAIPAPTLAIAAGALAAGGAVSFAEVMWETVAAQHIPHAALSRVYAYDWFGSLALEPFGLALIGPLAAGFGVSPTLLAIAAICVLCQVTVLGVASVRRMPYPTGPIPPRPLRPIEPGE